MSKMFAVVGLRVVAGLTLLGGAAAVIDESSFNPIDIIQKDVAIIGGGASGAHAAVRLREDLGKSVVVVEKQGQLVSTKV